MRGIYGTYSSASKLAAHLPKYRHISQKYNLLCDPNYYSNLAVKYPYYNPERLAQFGGKKERNKIGVSLVQMATQQDLTHCCALILIMHSCGQISKVGQNPA
jgi:hypothetical protein